ncbi:MAG: YtxH domain-containing protein [Candidatus Melainabacteria bacterium]
MSSFEKFVMGSLMGIGVGAVVGMLLAPRKGEETRRLIREDLAQRVAASKEKVSHTAQDVAQKVTTDVKSKVATLSDKAREISSELESVGRKTMERFDNANGNGGTGALKPADATPL